MTNSTRTHTVISRICLVLAASGALVFSAACTDTAPSDGEQQEQQQDDGGGDGDDGGDDD
ncbi:MAG: hypothetical protein M3308_01860 [Actinomycetota bacterium]|nr:hypothetical protein [Actinomycetota bacterium]